MFSRRFLNMGAMIRSMISSMGATMSPAMYTWFSPPYRCPASYTRENMTANITTYEIASAIPSRRYGRMPLSMMNPLEAC